MKKKKFRDHFAIALFSHFVRFNLFHEKIQKFRKKWNLCIKTKIWRKKTRIFKNKYKILAKKVRKFIKKEPN